MCGEVLGKGHALSGDACVLDGYCGGAEKLDKAIAEFAVAYADQSTARFTFVCCFRESNCSLSHMRFL